MSSSLVLGSGSVYRRELLSRLRVPFEVYSPQVDESRLADEAPRALALRLAHAKAAAVAERFPESWVIGSDQVAVCGERILGKPGSVERAVEQLRAASGQTVEFLTGVCVMRAGGIAETHLDRTVVHFRRLSEAEIARYVALEPALDCAGGFKCEGLGISLFERMESDDPTGLIGLPLIWVASALRKAGLM